MVLRCHWLVVLLMQRFAVKPTKSFSNPSRTALPGAACNCAIKLSPLQHALCRTQDWTLNESSSSSNEKSTENIGGTNDQISTLPTTVVHQDPFVNDGPFAFMSLYLDFVGVQEGKSIAFGPIPVTIDESKRQSEADALNSREKAARELQNLGMDERDRRSQLANVMGVISFVYVVMASSILDDGGYSGHFFRFLSIIPLFPAVGFKLSSETGL
jgi:hypothetical protein